MPMPAMPVGWGYSYLDWMGAYSYALALLGAFISFMKWLEKKSQTPVVAVNAQGVFAMAWMEHGMPGHKIVTQTLKLSPVTVASGSSR